MKVYIKWFIFLIFISFLLLLTLLLKEEYYYRTYIVPYERLIFFYSKAYGLDHILVTSVIKTESNFNATARSPKGALGLMQIIPATAKEMAKKLQMSNFHISDLYNPDINIKLGTFYLSLLLEEFGDVVVALAAYNGGKNRVRAWLEENYSVENFPIEETREFPYKVLANYKWFTLVYKTRSYVLSRLFS